MFPTTGTPVEDVSHCWYTCRGCFPLLVHLLRLFTTTITAVKGVFPVEGVSLLVVFPPSSLLFHVEDDFSNLPQGLSSLLSPQSSVPSQYRARSIHLLLSQVNWAGEQVRGATNNT